MPWTTTHTAATAIVGLGTLVIVGLALSQTPLPPSGEILGQGPTPTPTGTPTTTALVSRPKPKSKNVSRLQPKLTYDEALDQYRDRRFQFDGCVATPSYQTYKSGSRVMLDNRSPDSAEIRLDGVAHRLYGYEFTFVTLTATKLPHTVQVDCTSNDTPAYNVAQILLQR